MSKSSSGNKPEKRNKKIYFTDLLQSSSQTIRMPEQSITHYDIQALVDNELSWEEQKRVRAFIKEDREASKYYDDLCEQKALLKKWWVKRQ